MGEVLHVRRGEALSLRYHGEKEETIHVFRGRIVLEASSPHLEDLVRLEDRYGRAD